MKSEYIIDNDIVGQYIRDQLSQEETEEFEAAYFADPELAAMVQAELALHEALGNAERDSAPATDLPPTYEGYRDTVLTANHESYRQVATQNSQASTFANIWRAAAIVSTLALFGSIAYLTNQIDDLKESVSPTNASNLMPFLNPVSAQLVQTRSGSDSSPAIQIRQPTKANGVTYLIVPSPDNSYSNVDLHLMLYDQEIWSTTYRDTQLNRRPLQLGIPRAFVQSGIYKVVVEYSDSASMREVVEYRFEIIESPPP